MEISRSAGASKDEAIVVGVEAYLGRVDGGCREMRMVSERIGLLFEGGMSPSLYMFVRGVRLRSGWDSTTKASPAPCPKARKVQGESCMRGSCRG